MKKPKRRQEKKEPKRAKSVCFRAPSLLTATPAFAMLDPTFVDGIAAKGRGD